MNHELFQAIVTIMGMNADQLAVVTAALNSESLVGNALNPQRPVDANSNPAQVNVYALRQILAKAAATT